jgi:hypothetical protein
MLVLGIATSSGEGIHAIFLPRKFCFIRLYKPGNTRIIFLAQILNNEVGQFFA